MQKLFKRKKAATRETIELKEVIKQTISSIATAITEMGEDEALAQTTCIVSPHKAYPEGNPDVVWKYTADGRPSRIVREVQFTLSLSQTDNVTAGGLIGVNLAKIGTNRTTGKEVANTVTFSIPVVWPVNKANNSKVE